MDNKNSFPALIEGQSTKERIEINQGNQSG